MSKKNKRKTKKSRSDASQLIERAEKRLAKSLAQLDDARAKVSRRERDVADLLSRYGRTPAQAEPAAEAIPLGSPVSETSSNGLSDGDTEAADAAPVTADRAAAHEPGR
jgi:hypothetical protein